MDRPTLTVVRNPPSTDRAEELREIYGELVTTVDLMTVLHDLIDHRENDDAEPFDGMRTQARIIRDMLRAIYARVDILVGKEVMAARS